MNYQKILDEMLNKIKTEESVPRLLLHACCAPCSSYVLEYLNNYFDITIYYYNPNIYPYEEYNRRLDELKRFLSEYDTKRPIKLIEDQYTPDDYYESVKGLTNLKEGSIRCYNCYKFRMDKACNYAKENNFDYFTTTLSISPYKNSSWINEIGESLEKKYNVKYLYADFKKKDGYKRSLELSRKYNLYRQDYCGCVYSKESRKINKNAVI